MADDSPEKPCKNFELCGHMIPRSDFPSESFCMTCGSWFCVGGFRWDALEFRNTDEACAVCMETVGREMLFPTKCGHWFCPPCSKNILFWDETRYHLDPVPYGCPPCPNGCENPTKGRQCYCEAYDDAKNTWEHACPDEFQQWNDDENESIDTGTDPVFGSRKCPLCRQCFKR